MKTQRTPLIRFLVFRGLGPIFLLFLFAGKTRASFGHVDTLSPHSPNEDSLLAALASAKTRPAPETAAALSRLTRFGMGNLFTRFEYDPLLPYSLQVNPHAETYMNSYLRRHETSLTALRQWAVPYFDLIQTILSAYGLPHELKYLAVIESQLNTRATSRTGAAGPWQLLHHHQHHVTTSWPFPRVSSALSSCHHHQLPEQRHRHQQRSGPRRLWHPRRQPHQEEQSRLHIQRGCGQGGLQQWIHNGDESYMMPASGLKSDE